MNLPLHLGILGHCVIISEAHHRGVHEHRDGIDFLEIGILQTHHVLHEVFFISITVDIRIAGVFRLDLLFFCLQFFVNIGLNLCEDEVVTSI